MTDPVNPTEVPLTRRGLRPFVDVAIVTVVFGVACGTEPVGQACTEEARASVMVTIVDSVTGTGLARGATVVLQDGAYRDSSVFDPLSPVPGDSVFWPTGTFERAGNFTVRVRQAGYMPWERPAVLVTRDLCHVVTARVVARLQRTP